jgi:integrase
VARFKAMQAEQKQQTVRLKVTDKTPDNLAIVSADGKHATIPRKVGDISHLLYDDVDEAALWEWMREQLISRPEYVASMTGIEEVARLADLPKRKPSPKLKEVLDLYMEKSQTSDKQKQQVERFFKDFIKSVGNQGAKTLADLTPENCAAYADEILERKLSAKYIKSHFSGARTPINFARKRGVNPEDCRRALDCLAVCQAPKGKGKDPEPISVEDFKALLDAADKDRDKALMLTMLNCAMYGSEALALNWGDIDFKTGHLSTTRSKTGNARVSVLWKRTLKALKTIKPDNATDDTPVFISVRKSRLTHYAWNELFRAIRDKANVDSKVTAEHYRDGAQTAALLAGCELNHVKMLAGHDLPGVSDHYIRRLPAMVGDACKAIEKHYFKRVSR